MSESEAKAPIVKKKRSFKEKVVEEVKERESSSSSRSPSPGLPSRLDRIPSPSYGKDSDSPDRSTKRDQKDDKDRNDSDTERNVDKKRKDSVPSASTSPRRRSRSPRRKRSRSRDKRRSRSRDRNRRRKSRSRSRDRRRRSRSRSRDRSRRSSRRSRSRERRKSRSRSKDRRRNPRPRRKSRSETPPRFTSQWGVSRAVLSDKHKPKEVSTEEVEKRLAQHMKTVQEKAAEEAKKINLPGYLNPAMVNVHQFKQVQDKRKLLWSKPKDKKEGAALWSGAFDDQNNDEKFKRFMGIQGVKVDEGDGGSKVQESRKVLEDLEKEYQKSRAFQMSRGAGGCTGMGLGFGHLTQPQ